MPKPISLAILTGLFALFIGGAEIYKWVDEDGVVHFTDQPPQNQPSNDVHVLDEYPDGEQPQTEDIYRSTIEQQRARRDQRLSEKEEKEAERIADEEKMASSESNCARAIHFMNTLKLQCPVFLDGAGVLRAQCPGYYVFYEGERTYIDDNERAELLDHYEQVVAECTKLRK